MFLAERCNQAMSMLAQVVEANYEVFEVSCEAVAEMMNLLRVRVIQ